MSTRAGRTLALLAATAVVVSPTAPALAADPVRPEIADVPAALGGDLSSAEEAALSGLTDGGGVQLSALVETADGAEVVTFAADSRADAEDAVSLLESQPSVQAADVAGKVRATAGARHQYGNELVRSDAARAAVGSAISDVVVAVLDTGVASHPELDAALLPGQNFTGGDPVDSADRHGHGTHVAGTIGADAGSQVEGVAAGVRILPVKVLGDGGSGYTSWVAAGIVWAADNGADVINLSLGSSWGDAVEAAAVDYARAQGVTVVAAAGNWNVSDPFYPAAFPGVVAVSAVDQQRAKAYFSNHGSYIDVAGPGVSILSTVPGAGYDWYSGTSMAAPHVAAVAALAKAAGPGLTPDEVELVLGGTATDLGAAGRDDVFGRGLVDAVRAVEVAGSLDATGAWPGNEAPVAPDRTVTSRYTPGNLRVDVLAGATDPDGDLLALTAFTQGTSGTVRRDGGRLIWSPLRSGPFTDTFAYTVDDGYGARATGTVTVQVGGPDPANRAPVAAADHFQIPYEWIGGMVSLVENDSDPDGDPLRVVSVTEPELGIVEILGGGQIDYRKFPDIWGAEVDRFQYTVTDDRGRFATATVLVDVRGPNSVPVAHDDQVLLAEGAVSVDVLPLANDTDADADDWLQVLEVGSAQHGEVTMLSQTRVRYTPSGDLAIGTTDSFTYTVRDHLGATAQATVHVTVVAPAAPSAPGLAAVTPGNGSVVVRWSPPADPGTVAVSGYVVRVHQGATLVRSVSVGAAARSATVTGLVNGRSYRATVTATNAAGAGPASASSAAVTPRTVPGAPKIGSASAARKSAVVRWTAPGTNGGAAIDGYVVRVFSGGTLVKAVPAGPAARSLTVGGLTPGKAYAFRVLARNVAGLSPASGLSGAVTPRR